MNGETDIVRYWFLHVLYILLDNLYGFYIIIYIEKGDGCNVID